MMSTELPDFPGYKVYPPELHPGDERGYSPNSIVVDSKKNTVLVSHGRPPWYSEDGKRICDAFIIAVAGGSSSGKTHVSRQIVKSLGSIPSVVILSQDSFYKRHTPEEIALANASLFDFDHPDALDMDLYAECLSDLKSCKQTNIPIYSFAHHQRLDETQYLYGANIIIAEGIMALHDPKLRDLYDLKVFVQCDSDLMLARRITRDVKERGRDVQGILDQYLRYVKPSYDTFVLPTAAHADIIVPGKNNTVAIELISTHIRRQLKERENQFRWKMASPKIYFNPPASLRTPEHMGLTAMPMTNQLKGILTILRSNETSRQDFIFFADRLSTILVEFALQHLTYVKHKITTPIGVDMDGYRLDTQYICGVSIQRSGGVLERGFRRVINNAPMGTLLIQSDSTSSEPLLLQVKLPLFIRRRSEAQKASVLLMDAQIGTGAAAFMAIRVLLDHGVRQERIIFITFLVASGGGITVVRQAFPHVKIVCAAVDGELEEGWSDSPTGERKKIWCMNPGMGQIGDRYYL